MPATGSASHRKQQLSSTAKLERGATNTTRDETVFNWVVPVGLVIAMFRFMERDRAAHGEFAAREKIR